MVSFLRLKEKNDRENVVKEEEEEESDEERVLESDAISLVEILDIHPFEGVLKETRKTVEGQSCLCMFDEIVVE